MDADLAYCLDRFIDDQIKLIDENLEDIREEEIIEHDRIEQLKSSPVVSKTFQTIQGSHEEDEAIVQHFIEALVDNTESGGANNINALEQCRDELRTELSEKVKECMDLITRLRNLAKPILISANFVSKCDEILDRMSEKETIDENFRDLCQVIDTSDSRNIVENMQDWWKEKYGSAIEKILAANRQFNPGVSNHDIAVVLPKSTIISCAKKILWMRNEEPVAESQKHDIVSEFVQQINSIDDSIRQEISTDDLTAQLENSEVDSAISYAENWLHKRDSIRSQANKDDYYEQLWQEKKSQFDRRRVAYQSKKLALAALLRRLAIGSAHTDRFDRKLKETLDKQKQEIGIPVIMGDIREPSVENLPISIHLDGANIDQWSKNSNHIQEEFSSSLCRALRIPDRSIRISGIESGSVIIHAYVFAPYGINFIDSLNGTAPDSAERIKSFQRCCAAVAADIRSITIGDFALSIDHRLMDQQWNRRYLYSRFDNEKGEYWEGSINRGGKPYFCPSGWIRFGVKVAENDKEFDVRWGHWYIAYHGTQNECATGILTSGLRVSTRGCFYEKEISRIYVSPSIEYCAHPRYALPWIKKERDGRTVWLQLVFQCRVNPNAINLIGPETLIQNEYKSTVRVDPNFNNNELEWVILGKESADHIKDDIICYGVMIRKSDTDPKYLPTSEWWQYVHNDIRQIKYPT